MPTEDPRTILGIGPEATDGEIRAAYLRQIKQHPPERDPAQFERIRDAYEHLRDPRRRTHELLFSPQTLRPLDSLLDGRRAQRRFVGPKPWLAALKEK
jgi:curved DNA-binding protein CbpA